jgi:hypothetical protein
MAKNLNEIMQKLPRDRRAKIEARAEELIAEHMTLGDVRKARELTQERMNVTAWERSGNTSSIASVTD